MDICILRIQQIQFPKWNIQYHQFYDYTVTLEITLECPNDAGPNQHGCLCLVFPYVEHIIIVPDYTLLSVAVVPV